MLAGRTPGDTIVDVRRTDEYAASRVAGVVNVPLHELLRRLDSVPAGKLRVHCTSGHRAGTAASLLQRAGRDVVHIDAKFDDAASAGIPVGQCPRPVGSAGLSEPAAHRNTGRLPAFSGRV